MQASNNTFGARARLGSGTDLTYFRLQALAERGVAWEVATAMTLVEAGADILVLRHPGSVAVLREALDDLAKGA